MRFGRFFRFVVQRSSSMVWLMLGVGVLSGLLSAGVLALINYVVHHPSDHPLLILLGFVGLVAGKILSDLGSHILLVRFSRSRWESFRRGAANILVTLTDDVSWVTWAFQCFPNMLMSAALVLGCGIFLAWLSWTVFLAALGVSIVSIIGHQWLHTSVRDIIAASRDARAELFQRFRSLTDGLKELLMHRARRQEFVDVEVRAAAERYRKTNLEATRTQALLGARNAVCLYSLIGFILFLFPSFGLISSEALTGFIVTMIYMMSPIPSIIGIVPTLERGQVALENIERLGISLDIGVEDVPTKEVVGLEPGISPIVQWTDVVFSYGEDNGAETPFTLGPLSLELRPGELVFIIGGNGSGKSTLVKVLSGLYQPLRGEVRLADTMITDANREWYREHFSVVFQIFTSSSDSLANPTLRLKGSPPTIFDYCNWTRKSPYTIEPSQPSTSHRGSASGWRL